MTFTEFLEQSPLVVAPRILGATITCNSAEGAVTAVLTEVEAYCGPKDPGSHAYRSKTARNHVMFGPVGHLYVYLSYGMHWCANLVAHETDDVGAVLLRAARITAGHELVMQRRQKGTCGPKIASGPANLAQSLGLNGQHTGLVLDQAGMGITLAEEQMPFTQSGRVGVSGAGGDPEKFPWRYFLKDPSVSAYRKAQQR